MKDYAKLLNEETTWKSNSEIVEFESKYKKYIHAVLNEKAIDVHSRKVLYDDILIKFSLGELKYDSSRGKYETFLYQIIQNMTIDFYREKNRRDERHTEITEQNTSTLFDLSHRSGIELEYFRTIAIESLKRLYKAISFKKNNLEIFCKRCFAYAPIEQLSEDYNKSKSEISLIASRLHKKYKAIFREVAGEMDFGQMKYSDISIDFLVPFVDFLTPAFDFPLSA